MTHQTLLSIFILPCSTLHISTYVLDMGSSRVNDEQKQAARIIYDASLQCFIKQDADQRLFYIYLRSQQNIVRESD
jgi:hypothetical protein